MPHPRNAALSRALGAAAAACLIYTIWSGGRSLLRERTASGPTAAWESRARFLERARRLVPRGATVLAITEQIPAPDFDYWFGRPQPCDLLVVRNDRRARESLGGLAQADLDAVYEKIKSRMQLYTPESMRVAIDRCDWVVVADCDDPAFVVPGGVKQLSETGRSLWRVSK